MRGEGDHFIPHHTEATVPALPLTEMNEFNISPFLKHRWPPRCSSLSFFPCSAHKIPECAGGHLKESWQRLICFVALRDSCISSSIWEQAPPTSLPTLSWSRDSAYHGSLCLCAAVAVYSGSNKLCFMPWGKYCTEGSLIAAEAYIVVLQRGIKNKKDDAFFSVPKERI